MHRALLLALAVALAAPQAEAKNCTRGKPCGNSCIARNETCHKGSAGGLDSGGAIMALGLLGGLVVIGLLVASARSSHAAAGKDGPNLGVAASPDGAGITIGGVW